MGGVCTGIPRDNRHDPAVIRVALIFIEPFVRKPVIAESLIAWLVMEAQESRRK